MPWRRTAWVTWRQHRIALAGVAALLGVLAVWLWILGLQLHHAYAAATACNPASPACGDLITRFNFMNNFLVNGYILQPVPALIGAFAGAGNYAGGPVVHARRAEAQAHLLVRATADDPVPPGWEAHPVGLEELALAYLREPGATALPGPARALPLEAGEPSEATR